MPGARLTPEDRQRIATWLAGGLGYAEIARRLGRPTSTISREVARNGPPGDYRADHAQQATVRRAPRRRPAGPGEPAPGAAQGFAERFATLLTATGLPRMSARVFATLLTADSGSLTAGELVRRLRVSPASVSKSIGYLEAMDLVVRTVEPGSRRERYGIVDDVWLRAWRTDTSAHADVAAAARRGSELLGAATPAGVRLREMGRFFAWLSDQMGGSAVADTVAQDARTVVAALVHAAAPRSTAELAAALGWAPERVAAAVDALDRRPPLSDPLALAPAGPGTYTMTARAEMLTPSQRDALRPTAPPDAAGR